MIPVNRPSLSSREKDLLVQCIDTEWISSEGPFVTEFEQKFSQKIGTRHGIAVCNGSVAIDVAIRALGIGEGDEVILPSFTIISCANAIVRAGAVPIAVDCDPLTWNMDVSLIEKLITPKTKAIMVVHIYGLPVDMDLVLELAKKYNLSVIEDSAEAHGVSYKGRNCGTLSDISTFSFYPNKLITTGEGGMILTSNAELAKRCKELRNLCFGKEKRFVHEDFGWNFRMTNLQAALGVAQLERWDAFLKRKRHMAEIYRNLLSDLAEIQLPQDSTPYSQNCYWVFGVVLKDASRWNASQVMKRLAEKGVQTRPFFHPMHDQPIFKKMGLFKDSFCPNAEFIANQGFYLPSGHGNSDEDYQQSAQALREVLHEK